MTTSKKIAVLLLPGIIAFSFACKKDDPVSCNYAVETQDEQAALNTAFEAYIQDPTNAAKCQAYKNAAQAYLDELEDHVDCATTAGQQVEIQNAIDQTQAAVDAIQC